MSKDSIKILKGQPSKELPNLLLYEYLISEKTKMGEADITSSLELNFSNSELTSMRISKIESY